MSSLSFIGLYCNDYVSFVFLYAHQLINQILYTNNPIAVSLISCTYSGESVLNNTTRHELTISARTPETVVEGERFELIFHFKNRGQTVFPGGAINILVSWPALGPNAAVSFPIDINKPLSPNDIFEYSKEETPLVAGYTFFKVIFSGLTHNMQSFVPVQNGNVFLFLEDGRQITPNLIFGAVRAKSHEEIYSKEEVDVALKALRWAIYAFAATVAFGLIDVLLRFFLQM